MKANRGKVIIIHLSKFTECLTPRGNPEINYSGRKWWVSVGSLTVTNGPPWCTMSVVGRLCTEAGGIPRLPVPSTQFCCEPETALKHTLFPKKIKYMEDDNKCPLEPIFQKWFASSCLKEKNMYQIISKILFFYTKIMAQLTLFNRLRNKSQLFWMDWHRSCFLACWFRMPPKETMLR